MSHQPRPTIDDLLTADDVAAILKVSAKTVKRMVEADKFPPPVMAMSRPRWTLDDVRNWIERAKRERGTNAAPIRVARTG